MSNPTVSVFVALIVFIAALGGPAGHAVALLAALWLWVADSALRAQAHTL